MSDLSAYAVTHKWPARHPQRIQLYSLPTPNGVKVSIMLEETGLPYEPHLVRFEANDQMSAEFLSLSPNNKIPAILDPDGPEGRPLALFESGAILVYLAGKSGRFLPPGAAARFTGSRILPSGRPCEAGHAGGGAAACPWASVAGRRRSGWRRGA